MRDREESKRQSRVSQVIRSELAGIIRRPGGVKSSKTISETLRQKISIVDVQMSPDLRSAKVFVSVFGTRVEGREAYAWLVKHAKPMKHALSQSISHMKSVPDLHFKQTDIASAVDVMLTLDKLAAERRGQVDDADLHGTIDGLDFDFLEDDEGYLDTEDDEVYLLDDEDQEEEDDPLFDDLDDIVILTDEDED